MTTSPPIMRDKFEITESLGGDGERGRGEKKPVESIFGTLSCLFPFCVQKQVFKSHSEYIFAFIISLQKSETTKSIRK